MRIEIRQMTLEDLSEVWHLGEKLFTPSHLPFTYRAWNVDELLSLFNDDPELCLVAEDAKSGKSVGFALGVILKRPQSSWKYGYFNWVGVQKIKQKSGVGKRLYKELEKRFKQKGARIAIMDVENNNPPGVRFVKRGLGLDKLKVTPGFPRTSKISPKKGEANALFAVFLGRYFVFP